jgi:ferritin-like metal-binding protein YciE
MTNNSKTASPTAKSNKTSAKKDVAKNLNDFFEDALKDIYWAEKALTKALPKMAKNASSEKLKTALNDHLQQTHEHTKRLEKVFETIEKKATAKKCDAMAGLIEEGEGIMEETAVGDIRDVGIIAASQKVEHYEIATYGTLVALAKALGENEAMELLQQTLDEEKKADELLSTIAEDTLNGAAK